MVSVVWWSAERILARAHSQDKTNHLKKKKGELEEKPLSMRVQRR